MPLSKEFSMSDHQFARLIRIYERSIAYIVVCEKCGTTHYLESRNRPTRMDLLHSEWEILVKREMEVQEQIRKSVDCDEQVIKMVLSV